MSGKILRFREENGRQLLEENQLVVDQSRPWPTSSSPKIFQKYVSFLFYFLE